MISVSADVASTEDATSGKSDGDHSQTSARLSVWVTGFILLSVLLYALSLYSYLLFHTVAELASIVIAVVIFVITWYTRRFINNNYLVFIGIAYLFIGGIDLVHMLAYSGMNIFAGYDANPATQLWIAARTLQALTLLVAPFMLHRKMNERVVFAGYLTIFVLLMFSIFSWHIFPTCYIEGQGLTPFKIGMEYVISGILVLSAYLLYRNRDVFDRSVITLLYLSLAATILSELAFTTYVSVFGFTNFLGHIFKILAFLCIYLAIIDTGFSRPYALIFRDLSQSREELRDLNARLGEKVEERTKELRRSNEELQVSYEQLAITEEELRQQYSVLAEKDEAIRALNQDLEKRVEERTSELQQANEELSKAQEELREQFEELAKRDKLLSVSEERFRISAKSVSDVIWDWSIPDGRLEWYGRIDEILGYAPGEFPRTLDAWEKIIHPDDRDRVMAILDRHLKTQTPYAAEYRVVRKDGEIRYWTDQGTAMQDDQGRAYRMVGSCSDITERKRAEEALIASEVRYRRLFEAAQDGILILDAETGQIVDVNPFLIDMLGFSHEQFVEKKIWDIGIFKDIVANKDNFEELQRKEHIRYEDLPLETADGRNIAVEFVSNVYMVNDKKVIQCNIRDITERKLAEEERARLAAIVEYSDDAIIGKTLDGIITSWNAGAERIYGYSAQEIIGKNISLLVPPDQPDDAGVILERIRNSEPVVRYETLRRKKDGGQIIVSLTVSPIKDAQNHLIGASAIARDVTRSKQAEEALRESEAKFHDLLENASDLIQSVKPDGAFIYVNRAWCKTLGYTEEEIQNLTIFDIIHADSQAHCMEIFQRVMSGETVDGIQAKFISKDGNVIDVEGNASCRFIDGKPAATRSIFRDITERKKQAAQIEASLAEKETLLKEIHHRVKNNLQIITSILNLQIRKTDDPTIIEALKDSQSRVRSMALVHEHLYKGKDFAHIDLGNYIQALAMGLFQSYEAAKQGIRFDLNIRDIYVDINTSVPLGLMCNELITNSLKYAFREKKDGKISITATEDPQALTFIVADNGTGMPEGITLENQTSLGLRLVSLLTSQIKGTVVIDRTEGTKFVFTIPKTAEQKPAGEAVE